MLHLLHLFHDDKFIDIHIARFNSPLVKNTYWYFSAEFTYNGKYKDLLKQVVPFSEAYHSLGQDAGKFDIIFIYHLDYNKAFFINAIPEKPLLIWHFYGIEVYNQASLRKYNYSKRTKSILNARSSCYLKNKFDNALLASKRALKEVFSYKMEVPKAIQAIDYFTWYNKDEYDYLKSHVPALPPFLQLPITTQYPDTHHAAKDKIRMLVGNSAAPENNHLDILWLLQELQYKGEINMPLGYGRDSVYKARLLQIIKDFRLDIRVLEDFMPYQEYLKLLGTVTTAIFNSYRQMALGNIFILLFYGTKVYLSEKNPTYPWLKKLGFHIYSIEADLERELKSGELQLDAAQMLHNKSLYTQMADVSGLHRFIEQLPTLVKTRKP